MVTEAFIARCKQIVGDIISSAEQCGALKNQIAWQSTRGGSLYSDTIISPSAINEPFLRQLSEDRQKFTGLPSPTCARRRLHLPPSMVFHVLGAAGRMFSPDIWQGLASRGLVNWPLIAFSRAAMGLPRRYICELPPDSPGIWLGRYIINPASASYQERMAILHRAGIFDHLRDKQRPAILEIGGGFGALAFCIKKVVPHARYIIVDLPGSLVHSGCWLAQWWPESSISVYVPGTDIPDDDFVLVPHTAFSAISGVSIDLAVNTLSFAEMPLETVSGYAREIAARLAPDGLFFEQNFDNAANGPGFCNPPDALKNHFPHRRIVPGRYWRGTPSVWSLVRS